MLEAEFDGGNGTFPDSFRWDTLRGCLRDKKGCCAALFTDRSVSNDGKAQSVRRLCGTQVAYFDKQDIDVLWLSPTVFISTMDLELHLPGDNWEPNYAYDYALRLTTESGEYFLYNVYSLSFFEGNGFTAPSPLPMNLLRHVFANVRPGYFKTVELGLSYAREDERLPVECLLAFVAIVPDTPMSPSERTDAIQLKIETKMNRDDLQEMYSHHFHPSVELSFAGLDESVPLSMFLELSRGCQHLRTVNLPEHFFETGDIHPTHSRVVVDSTFKSTRMTLQSFGKPKFSHVMLHQIATGLGSKELNISVEHPWRRRDHLHLCIQPFLQEDSILERIGVKLLTRVNKSSSSTITQCQSRSLCFFDVSLAPRKGKRTSAHLASWDKVLFPRLSLNYYRKHLTQRVCGGAIPLAIKAVNMGIVYSKTTAQVPFDMSTANAGLIFRFLKCEVDTLHCCDACPPSSSLSGKKRPAPS
jgi:hypothetical protein